MEYDGISDTGVYGYVFAYIVPSMYVLPLIIGWYSVSFDPYL